MGLFRKSKNGEGDARCCGSCAPGAAPQAEAEKAPPGVKVLGAGCAKCRALEQAAREALAELGMEAAVEHVTELARIAASGVMSTPALMVDGKVVSCGRALTKDEAKALIRKARA